MRVEWPVMPRLGEVVMAPGPVLEPALEPTSRAGERGSGTVLGLTLVGAIVSVTVAALGVLGAFPARQNAVGAADAAALVAADTLSGIVSGDPCGRADELARANGAVLDACSLDGDTASVTVHISWGVFTLVGRSRAGPPR